jgi:hypothetical protein
MIKHIRHRAKENIKNYIDERLPEEYEKCLVGISSILRESWDISQQAEDNKEKIQALSLAKECYSMKLDLITNATVLSDAVKFVSSYHHQELNNNNSNKKEEVASSLTEQKSTEETTNKVFE